MMKYSSCSVIVQSLRAALAQPSVRVGQRLLSERKLALRLNVTHNQMRKSLLDLVDEGVLTQKRGSGTFVKRVPDLSTIADKPAHDEVHGRYGVPDIHPHQILHLHGQSSESEDGMSAQLTTSYDIGLWWDNLIVMTPLQQFILQGMILRTESLGHRLSVHPMTPSHSREPLDSQTLRQRVMAHRNDGYLCIGWSESEFSRFLTEELESPVIFFNTDGQRLIASPNIVFDTHNATQHAVKRLQNSGCKNIWDIQLNIAKESPTSQGRYVSPSDTHSWLSLNVFDTPSVSRLVSQWLAQTTAADPHRPVDGIYVADDHMLEGVVAALRSAGRMPGRDVAVISMANEGLPQPWPVGRWSQLRFDPRQLGTLAVDMLVRHINDPKAHITSIALRADWVPEQSHLLAIHT